MALCHNSRLADSDQNIVLLHGKVEDWYKFYT